MPDAAPWWQYLASCLVFGVLGTLALLGVGLVVVEAGYRALAWLHRRRFTS